MISCRESGSVVVTPIPKSFSPSPMSSPNSSSTTSRKHEPSAAGASGASPMQTTSSSPTRRTAAPWSRTSTPGPLKSRLKRQATDTGSSGARRETSAMSCRECGRVSLDTRRHAVSHSPRRSASGATACDGTKTSLPAHTPGSRALLRMPRAAHASGPRARRSARLARIRPQSSSERPWVSSSGSSLESPSSAKSASGMRGASSGGRKASDGEGGACRWKPT
mmetsp:Transcript_14625/g.43862  ORF Transcript_14625/g.43862 Transcript_14625/m.43862 type:complete len:222 (+) Transcript_14625:503-1168(+)